MNQNQPPATTARYVALATPAPKQWGYNEWGEPHQTMAVIDDDRPPTKNWTARCKRDAIVSRVRTAADRVRVEGKAMSDKTTRRRYVDRMGREITDPAVIQARYVTTQLRRLETVGCKNGREWPYVKVGELAKATKLTAERIIEIVRRYGDVWLIGLIEDGPTESWGVFQDGE